MGRNEEAGSKHNFRQSVYAAEGEANPARWWRCFGLGVKEKCKFHECVVWRNSAESLWLWREAREEAEEGVGPSQRFLLRVDS